MIQIHIIAYTDNTHLDSANCHDNFDPIRDKRAAGTDGVPPDNALNNMLQSKEIHGINL